MVRAERHARPQRGRGAKNARVFIAIIQQKREKSKPEHGKKRLFDEKNRSRDAPGVVSAGRIAERKRDSEVKAIQVSKARRTRASFC